MWFSDTAMGDTKIEFDLVSNQFKLKDVFAYNGENYVPEDYRHEQFDNLKIHGFADLHFKDSLYSLDLFVNQLETDMKIHPMRFEDFIGRIHIENSNLTVQDASGKVGKTDFTIDMNYFFGDTIRTQNQNNSLFIKSKYLDVDQLTNYNPLPATDTVTAVNHDSVFNIYELPFPKMDFYFDVKQLKYHRYNIADFYAKFHSQENHYLYIDTMSLNIAGGELNVKGYFDGSNANLIYLNPDLKFKNIDIDQLLFKFENFGQDYVVNDQLHGYLSGELTGKIHMHTDMVPSIDDSEIQLTFEVANGSLENYGPMEYMADYFKDKNLSKVLFDTLRNQLNIVNGETIIPKMLINSSLGYLELSGKQDLDGNFEYYFTIPVKLIKSAARSKLFGARKKDQEEGGNEIIYKDDSNRSRYVNVKMIGNSNDFKITLGKPKK